MVQDSQVLSGEGIFAFLFNSDRAACIRYIRENGEDAFAEKMAKDQQMTMKRK